MSDAANPIEPPNLSERAGAYVDEMFKRRLIRSKIATKRPELYFMVEPQRVERLPVGFQVRVKTWRYWSECRATLQADTGEVMGWGIDEYAEPANEVEITEEAALVFVSGQVEVPADAELKTFHHFDFAARHRVAVLEWDHVHQNMRVDGDSMRVVLHPQTGKIIEYFLKWRAVRL